MINKSNKIKWDVSYMQKIVICLIISGGCIIKTLSLVDNFLDSFNFWNKKKHLILYCCVIQRENYYTRFTTFV